MEIYEDFIKDLLKNDIIKNYTAKRTTVREFYLKEYRTRAGRSPSDFVRELWYYWYINRFSKTYIHFDQPWTIYISQLLEDTSQRKKKQYAEENYLSKDSCQLCKVKFTSDDAHRTHRESLKHKVRVQYLTDKSTFTQSEELCLKVIEVNNITNISGDVTEIKLEPKRNLTATLRIINTSSNDMQIVEMIQINPHVTDITINQRFEQGKVLEPDELVTIVLNGYFENSASLVLPIVVIAKYVNEEEAKYFLKDIPIEITSEFSDLVKPGSVYIEKKHILHDETGEVIVPGKKPSYTSYYAETFPLRLYHIPPKFKAKLDELIRVYPSFIERQPINKLNIFFYKEYAKFLNINSVLKERNHCQLLQAMIDIEENQMRYDIRKYDMVSKLKHIRDNIFELEVPESLGEARPSLLVTDSVYVKQNESDICKYEGIVYKVLENSVHLSFNKRFLHIFTKKSRYHIQFGYNRRTYKVQKQALTLASNHNILSFLYAKENAVTLADLEQTVNNSSTITYFTEGLNDEQKRAVKNILEVKTIPYLIFGPPGTGKTVTVVEAILQVWSRQPKANILVCAPSNSATNEIAMRLLGRIPKTDIFRLVSQMYGSTENCLALKDIVNINKNHEFFMPSMSNILKFRVVLTTLVTAARLVNGGVPNGHYSHVFIDESGYATESESLIPIAGILSNSDNQGKVLGQVVLAGDPRQLGPVVFSSFAKYCGYERSMLERLIDTCQIYARDESNPMFYNEKYITKLIKNYRSHESILTVPNQLFYHGELVSADKILSNTFTDWEHLKTPGFPIIFHHVIGEDRREKDSPSFFNVQEIEEVVEYVSKVLQTRVKDTEITQEAIGIITPYKKQANMLRRACERRRWNDILVGSVEQFQGKEKLVIIISTVRSKNINKFEDIDKKCQLGFVRNPKRFNVALTRAKALLIVIGNADVLKDDKNWRCFIEYCVANKCVAGKAFNLSDTDYLNEESPLVEEEE